MHPESQVRLDRFEVAAADPRDHIDATTVETRRHFDGAAERIRGDLRPLVEGVFARIDRVEITLRKEIARSYESLATMIRTAHVDLERRVRALERRAGDSDREAAHPLRRAACRVRLNPPRPG